MTLLIEAPVPDLYTLEVVTSRLAEPRTMTVVLGKALRVPALTHNLVLVAQLDEEGVASHS
jgi:hypothetical protein